MMLVFFFGCSFKRKRGANRNKRKRGTPTHFLTGKCVILERSYLWKRLTLVRSLSLTLWIHKIKKYVSGVNDFFRIKTCGECMK